MGRSNTVWGAYDSSFEDEINRTREQLIEMGIKGATKLEITALIAKKNKMAKMNKSEVINFFSKCRGLR